MQEHFSLRIQNAEKHLPGMQIDSAVVFVWFRVESHSVRPPLENGFRQSPAYDKNAYAQGGPYIVSRLTTRQRNQRVKAMPVNPKIKRGKDE